MDTIACLGLGTIGRGMADNLLEAGHPLVVWNRTPERCQPLVDRGADRVETPAEAAGRADVVKYCFADDEAVKAVVFGEDGILEAIGHV